MDIWNSVLFAITGNTIALAILGYLAKSLLEKFIAQESRQFEADLKAKADASVERLRNELQLRTIEHQVRFLKLHEKRAEIIAELYRKLQVGLWSAEIFLSPMQWAGDLEPKEKHAAAMNGLVDAYRYFGEHRIYLPHELCLSLENFLREIRSKVISLGVWVEYDERTLPDHAQKQKNETWMSAWNAITKEIPKATLALEEEFRSLLGAAQASDIVN